MEHDSSNQYHEQQQQQHFHHLHQQQLLQQQGQQPQHHHHQQQQQHQLHSPPSSQQQDQQQQHQQDLQSINQEYLDKSLIEEQDIYEKATLESQIRYGGGGPPMESVPTIPQLRHWSEVVYESKDVRIEEWSIAGGSDYGQLPYFMDSGDILLEVNGYRVAGLTRNDVIYLIHNKPLVDIKAVSSSSSFGLPIDLREYLSRQFARGSVDHDLQITIRDNVYMKTIPCTTRLPRSDEIDGVDYKFISTEEFMEMERSGVLLESGIFMGRHYGTPLPLSNSDNSIVPMHPNDSNSTYENKEMLNRNVSYINSQGANPDDPNSDSNENKQNHPDGNSNGESVNGPGVTANQFSANLAAKRRRNRSNIAAIDASSLPHGWEKISDAHYGVYYIDHINKRTQYERPYEIELTKGENGFGFTLIELDKGLVVVKNIVPRGPADQSGVIQPGDVLVSVSGVSVSGLQHSEIARLFGTFVVGDRVKLTFARGYQLPPEFTMEEDKEYEFINISLTKGSDGFGFTISDSDKGQKVKKILDTERCGPLRVGDILVTVNNTDLSSLPHVKVVEALKQCSIGETSSMTVKRKKKFRSKTPLTLHPSNTFCEKEVTTPQRNCKTPNCEMMLRRDFEWMTAEDQLNQQHQQHQQQQQQQQQQAVNGLYQTPQSLSLINNNAYETGGYCQSNNYSPNSLMVNNQKATPSPSSNVGLNGVPHYLPQQPHPHLQHTSSSMYNMVGISQQNGAGLMSMPSQLNMDPYGLTELTSDGLVANSLVVNNPPPPPPHPHFTHMIQNGDELGTGEEYLAHNRFPDEDDYEYFVVTLTRGEAGFGFRIVGGAEEGRNISVGSIVIGGVAHKDGILKAGDEILSINARDITGASHHTVVNLMSSCDNTVSLLVRRKKNSDAYDVVLQREATEDFGFVIISYGNCALIGRIIEASPAHRCGRLRIRDKIIMVNGHDIRNTSHPEVVNMIKESGHTLCLRIIPADSYSVELIRGPKGFGFSIRGGAEFNGMPLFILRIAPDGSAHSLLNVGDEIIEINGISTVKMTHAEAVQVIHQSGAQVKLKLRRNANPNVVPPPAYDGTNYPQAIMYNHNHSYPSYSAPALMQQFQSMHLNSS
ncbi:membrane-associated guanylate kinase, WW and PDZ domain-containing protein 3-like [Panonychus citri]|uniref:membrane-associated guanylate kinase, WW and PDZ domain-containing protein 3-like n=1 Tax=Panonychus citri TaxID=50023 RepID=UPI002307F768|nr:membrane-associated guanylate kinase, WW and PDZ domain-containing protein 3-like [Panonychus citri]